MLIHSSIRLIGMCVLLGSFGCGKDPEPLAGRVTWSDRCPAPDPVMMIQGCTSGTHVVNTGADCSIVPVGSTFDVSFRVANLSGGATSFDQSQEAISVTGSVTSNLMSEMDPGTMILRGQGWEVAVGNGTVGVGGPCHVFIDSVSGGNFSGRLRCDGVRDTEVPPRMRTLEGNSQTRSIMYADFSFSNCRTE